MSQTDDGDDEFRGSARFQGGARFGESPAGSDADADDAATPSATGDPSGSTGYTPSSGTTGYTPSYRTTDYTPPAYGTSGYQPPNYNTPANPYVGLTDPSSTASDAVTVDPPSTSAPWVAAGSTGVDPSTVTSGPAEDTRVVLGRIEPKRIEVTRVAPPAGGTPARPATPAATEPVVVRMPPRTERIHPSVHRRNQRRTRRYIAVASAVGVIGIALLIVFRLVGGPTGIFDSRPNIEGDAEPFDTRWQVTADALLPGAGEFLPMNTGDWFEYRAPYLIPGDGAWAALVDDATVSLPDGADVTAADVVAFDPETGDLLWDAPLPGGLCSERLTDAQELVCLGRADGDGWAMTIFSMADGAIVATHPVDIDRPWNVHLSAAGLLVFTEAHIDRFTTLSLLSVTDGTLTWSRDLAHLPDTEDLFREDDSAARTRVVPNLPIWRDVGANTLLWASSVTLHIDPVTGALTPHRCHELAVVADTFACDSGLGTTRFAADGTQLWHSEEVGLEGTAFLPAPALVNTGTPGMLRATDWDRGGVGDPLLEYPLPQSTNLSGTAQFPFFNTETELVSLSEDGGSTRWIAEIRNMNSITDVVVVDDVAIVTGFISIGLDLDTGEVVWSRNTNGDIRLVDGRPVSFSYNGFALLELPEG
ncbi:outer membrane protein assembly factor BamB family protein [Occultella gossypii]|uniref:PQQ-binding-like beta-propeller repeat protein n=1 Tax=Occultella gossypii TaxID=2800820 RepID=A0ABS7SGK1_9MICO|nr:PQQ-binding-like beta-propeller repeat protein [Occultella gossypii]MBZ2199491.1 PQQ-binding-like beta-propeller repeat protein [Occultella gossypii]